VSREALHLADDCALLPARDGMVVYKGEQGRALRVQPHIGQWLSHGVDGAGGSISQDEKQVLLELGVIRPGTTPRGVSINALAPAGVAGWSTLSLLASFGILAWTIVLPELRRLVASLLPLLQEWTTWAFVPVAALAFTLGHEWGHVLALRAMGGRAGRLQLRFGWPWAVTVVGPFRSVLDPWRQLVLAAGGVIVEAVVLGGTLLCLAIFGTHPVLAAVAVTEALYITFNLLPTPWSDGGQILAIVIRQLLSLVGRRAGHD